MQQPTLNIYRRMCISGNRSQFLQVYDVATRAYFLVMAMDYHK
jgi:hypothetical protein